MKNLFFAGVLILGLTSCSKDSFDATPVASREITKSEVLVTVSHLVYDNNQCNPSCGTGNQVVAYVNQARIDLFPLSSTGTDALPDPVRTGYTDQNGRVLLPDMDAGDYLIRVVSIFGEKERVISLQLHRRAYIDFSF